MLILRKREGSVFVEAYVDVPNHWHTTAERHFCGPNNCGSTCAINLLQAWVYQGWVKGTLQEDESDLHNQLYRSMRIGRLGAHILKWHHGMRRAFLAHGVKVRSTLVLWITPKSLYRHLKMGRVVPICLLRDKHYGWHWVLAIGLRESVDGWRIRIADGWQSQPIEIPFYAPGRVGMHALWVQPSASLTPPTWRNA